MNPALSTEYLFFPDVAQGCYYAEIEDSWRKMMLVDGRMHCVEVELIREYDEDLVSPAWSNHHEEYIQNGEEFLLIYSVASRATFDRLAEFRERAVRGKPAIPPMIVAGNQCDKRHSEREVSTEEGAARAVQFGCPFIETSAKTGENVERAFVDVVHELRERTPIVAPDGWKKRGRGNRCIVL
ncbi:ras protein [Mycena rebaudengoi]|nr:ras protein [Mycena rebaudengoi]